DEAIENLELVFSELMKEYVERGEKIPKPASITQAYSGKFVLKIPKSLHRALAEAAERDSVSLNQMVIHLLSSALQQESIKNYIIRIEREMGALKHSLTEWKSSFVVLAMQPTTGLPEGTYAEEVDAAA
ncbi:MAG: toxin-antitoxin system HicB family antitoxin, partial [Deltaproteobacteria bacterium]|nr:toxin-antitoxin system HicB family antitoxin [Deltaproteobacteria bacterium]